MCVCVSISIQLHSKFQVMDRTWQDSLLLKLSLQHSGSSHDFSASPLNISSTNQFQRHKVSLVKFIMATSLPISLLVYGTVYGIADRRNTQKKKVSWDAVHHDGEGVASRNMSLVLAIIVWFPHISDIKYEPRTGYGFPGTEVGEVSFEMTKIC